ncbi:YbaB/EbfC family nucleoid-associated protein [Calderihabitans maritimus]|uniref:Nucleoid-associated protein KKC1_27610 n=1 Tax=Calderihabitans maritimus TaxID=1246530 RepID=A0A1Z5HVR6_9FIRM|nr:YbaB/EbfC family nucleoid-associated protein [Calderihabitans maritimus]GAW93633.1 hypothetical protein KKC1_27610 [Calderihabitans maritimus]
MGMGKMMKQIQKMQAQMAKLQEELEEKTVEASSGGGAVKVVVNGKQELVSIKIQPDAVNAEDTEILEDLIMAAVNEGLRKAQEMVAAEMSKITGGMKLPGLF